MKRSIGFFVLVAGLFFSLLATGVIAEPSVTEAGLEKPRQIFEFHTTASMNLHHFLYWKAFPHSRETGMVADWPESLSETDRQVITEAVAYYTKTFKDQDLLFGEALSKIKRQLTEHDGGASFAGLGLESEHAKVLERALLIYRWNLWPAHRVANQQWISETSHAVRKSGSQMVERLEAIYGDEFPPTPIRVDVVVEGHWAGAFTTINPMHVVVVGTRPDYQEKGGLEMIFHEASHGMVGPRHGTVISKLSAAFEERDERSPRGLWHALLFYTTGEVAKQLFVKAGQGPYEPYAHKNGLFEGPWGAFLPALENDWQAAIDGEVTMDEAVEKIVARLAVPKSDGD